MGKLILGMLLALASLAAHAGPAIGDAPPDVLGKTMQGDPVRLGDRRGKVVIVAFWASWCPFCRKELPVLETIQKTIPQDRLEVILVDYQEPTSTFRDVARMLRRSGFTITHDRDGAISKAYDVQTVPQLFMVDKSGRVGWTYRGYAEEDIPQIGGAIDRLLAEPASATETETAAAAPQGG